MGIHCVAEGHAQAAQAASDRIVQRPQEEPEAKAHLGPKRVGGGLAAQRPHDEVGRVADHRRREVHHVVLGQPVVAATVRRPGPAAVLELELQQVLVPELREVGARDVLQDDVLAGHDAGTGLDAEAAPLAQLQKLGGAVGSVNSASPFLHDWTPT